MRSIYFDNNATSPLDPQVVEVMLSALSTTFGNPSSGHRFGEAAHDAVEQARRQTAKLLNCSVNSICFVSCGTEGNNSALWSGAWADPKKCHIISSTVEHPSVLGMLRFLQDKWDFEVEILPVDSQGGLDLDLLENSIRSDTAIVSLMGANNETGVIWPIEKIAALCSKKGTLFHCDAVQMAGKVALDVNHLGVDYLTLSAHKLHGPKGCGLIYMKRGVPFTPLIMGPGQENGRRGGTENVAGIVGFGKACELAEHFLQSNDNQLETLRNKLENHITNNIDGVRINGSGQPRLPNTINVSFEHCSSAMLTQELDEKGIAISAHSACHSGDLDPSHVLTAMAIPESYLHGTLRISLNRYNTEEEVDYFLDVLSKAVKKSRHGLAL